MHVSGSLLFINYVVRNHQGTLYAHPAKGQGRGSGLPFRLLLLSLLMSQYYSFVTTGKTIINIRDMINYKLYIESALQIINCYREEKYEVSEKNRRPKQSYFMERPASIGLKVASSLRPALPCPRHFPYSQHLFPLSSVPSCLLWTGLTSSFPAHASEVRSGTF